ncbi:MAG: hypothetical protein P4M11_02810 [Candidatus Pacebacteria bacterium]|nr:hypothetical protein [Candidatus Paceibacterota bacterium]
MKNFSLNSIISSLSSLRYSGRLRPDRDWLMLLSATFVVLLASIIWSVWFFVTVGHGTPASGVKAPTSTQSSAAAVVNVQNVFKDRAAEDLNYQKTYTFVDPSL